MSYNDKHNDANGENNNDGDSHNRSWNCGVEGPTDDAAINALRARQQRNFLATLLLSQGVPMISHGDELGRTQSGNNNGYCQDNDAHLGGLGRRGRGPAGVHRMVAALRAAAPGVPPPPVLHRPAGPPARHRTDCRTSRGSTPDGSEMTDEDWDSGFGKSVAVFLNGQGIPGLDPRGQRVTDDSFVLCFNAHHEPIEFTLPPKEFGAQWQVVIDTANPTNEHGDVILAAAATGPVQARALVVLQEVGEPKAVDRGKP